MQVEKLVLISLLGVLAAGGDGGCFGPSDEPPSNDAGVARLTVRARTARPGPHPKHSVVELEAEATGGVPPYLFTWKESATTIDPSDGRGEIAVGDSGVLATVSVVDSTGYAATDWIEIEVEGDALALTIQVRGPGRVEAGALGSCREAECIFEVEPNTELELFAIPIGDGRFDGWSGCSSSSSRSIAIQVATSSVACTARFSIGNMMLPCDAIPPPPGPIADVVVRPMLADPPFPKNASGFHVIPRDVEIFIDGLGSRPQAGFGLDFDWTVTWDPLRQVPDDPVAFFAIQSAAESGQRSDAFLTVTDDCGRTATATATYITE